jgi:hypothetical protein
MRINKENYELWFIDYLDGKLNAIDQETLRAFLNENPDLERELELYESYTLQPETLHFTGKENLKKFEADVMGLEPVDYLLIKQMEDGLNDIEEEKLASFTKEDETVIGRGKEYHKTRLVHESVIFPNKTAMLRHRIRPAIFYISGVSASAILAILFFLGWYFTGVEQVGEEPITMNRLSPIEIPVHEFSPAPLESRTLAPIAIHDEPLGEMEVQKSKEIIDIEEEKVFAMRIEKPQPPMSYLKPQKIELLPVEVPDAYELGLRHMMPLYLDNFNNSKARLADESYPKKEAGDDNLLLRGLQFVDKVSGILVNFDRVYDEEGNFVAYNFRTVGFEMERKVRR